jgi:hypothetical protein
MTLAKSLPDFYPNATLPKHSSILLASQRPHPRVGFLKS